MKRTQSLLMIVLLALIFTLVAIFSFVACKSHEKTAGIQVTTDIPVTSKSDKAKAAFQQGLALLDEGSTSKAKEMFTKAIEIDSNLAVAYLYRTGLGTSPKEFMDDLAKAKAHLEGASEWEKLYYDLQNTFVTNDWNKRLETAQKIVAAYPAAARAQVDLGFTYQAANQTDKERAAFKKAIELDPKWIGGYNSLGISYLFSEPRDFKKAEENALKVVELTPKNPNAQIALGDCYRAQDDLEKARAAYMKAIELNPDEPNSYYKKGHINSFLGKYDEARNDYMEAAEHDNNNLGAMLDIGNTYLYAGDHNAALKSFMDAAAKVDASGASPSKISSDKLNYLYSCAMTCFHYGDAARLKEIIAMMQGPSDQVAAEVGAPEQAIQKASLSYWWSLASAVEGKLDDAKAKAEEMKTTLEPVKSPTKLQDYEMALGYISMKEKKYTDAISHFEKANPTTIYTKYWQAMANEAAGNKDKAQELFK
ncbi:MAG: tetratricopeptide repeat protein, partial [Bacteroidota bacterium]|nr:tetratricopeptide repeat protein [Bacteroidota bacterium]